MKKLAKLLICLIICLTFLAGCSKQGDIEIVTKATKAENETETEALITCYLASTQPKVSLYQLKTETRIIEADEEETGETKEPETETYEVMAPFNEAARGSVVEYYESEQAGAKTFDGVVYAPVYYNGASCFVIQDQLSDNPDDVVHEKEKYVQTPVNVYANCEDSALADYALAKKGSRLEIKGFDEMAADGSINMYQVSFTADEETHEGWVYAKYLADTEEEALENYNVDGIYDIHKDRDFKYDLYGGLPANLDYYPKEKPEFADNPFCKEARAIYLNCAAVDDVESYIDIAKAYGVNAMVVDIKDGRLAYHSDAAEIYNPTANNYYYNEQEFYGEQIKKLKDAGIYVIGRIVVFNDDDYVVDHPENCINDGYWPSAFSRDVWRYNVELALEGVRNFGFNEIQLDYVRFPESAYDMSENGADFKDYYYEEKGQAIQNFLMYAADEIHKEGAYLSVDVFGESSGEYVTAYGQYYPAISNVVDAISSMPYTDHWGQATDTWTYPYDIMHSWALKTYMRRNEIPTPAADRTWITAYNTPFWNPTVVYDADKISEQVWALYDAGLSGGFITWNAGSSIAKYDQIGPALGAEYTVNENPDLPEPETTEAEQAPEEDEQEEQEEADEDN